VGSNPAGRTTLFPLDSFAMWTKIFLLLILWWIWRVVVRMIHQSRRRAKMETERRERPGETTGKSTDLDNLSRQDISDADFEDIP
jgi:hypothetical protein